MAGFLTRAVKWSSSKIKNQNLFKENITLTHKSSGSIISVFAGCVSIAMIGFLLVIGSILTLRMARRTEKQWNQNVLYTNLASDTTQVTSTSFDGLAVRVSIQTLVPEYLPDRFEDFFDVIEGLEGIGGFGVLGFY